MQGKGKAKSARPGTSRTTARVLAILALSTLAVLSFLRFHSGRVATMATRTAPPDSSGAAAASKPALRSRMNRFDKLQAWLRNDCGAVFPDLEVREYSPSARGVHVKKDVGDVPVGRQILSIPMKCIITEETGKTTELGQIIAKTPKLESVDRNIYVLLAYILESREGGTSFFQPYYDILPAGMDNFPIFWSDALLAKMKGSDIVGLIRERKEDMRKNYMRLCDAAPAFGRFSLNDFLWARTIVGSRNFRIFAVDEKSGKKKAYTAMVPYADMLNHERPKVTSWTFSESQRAFVITSTLGMKGGQQVMDSYGKKTNSRCVCARIFDGVISYMWWRLNAEVLGGRGSECAYLTSRVLADGARR